MSSKILCANTQIVDVDTLIPNPKNPNKHPAKQIAQLAKIIKHQGQRLPIVVSKRSGFIVAGHGRLEAIKSLGWAQCAVDEQEFATEADEYAHMIADNKIAELAEHDDALMIQQLTDMKFDLDLDLLGMDDFKLPEIVEPQCDEDEVPEQVDTRCKRGDVWVLGSHRLMCGDSTMIDDVEKLMNGEKADVVFTSPPYNANTKVGQGSIFNGKKMKKLYGEGYSDNLESENYIKFSKDVLEMCFAFTDGFIFWNVSYNANSRFEYISQITDRLPFLSEQICWKKSSTIPFKGSLRRDWEPIFLFSTSKKSLNLDEVVSNHWAISNTNAQQESHKACFPVDLPEKGISLVNKKTGIVFEPFGGSGSTLIACEKTGRKCYMMELDEHYCDVILTRWEKYTGKQAERVNG